jgi:hypothetical protein
VADRVAGGRGREPADDETRSSEAVGIMIEYEVGYSSTDAAGKDFPRVATLGRKGVMRAEEP